MNVCKLSQWCGALALVSGLALTAGLSAQTTAPATQPAVNPVLATINGQSVDRARFFELLMAIHGPRMFEQVLEMELVRQATVAAGITVGQPQMQAELDRVTASFEAQGIPKAQHDAALNQLLQRQNVSFLEFQMGLQKAAGLRALAKDKVKLTEADYTKAQEAEYGPKLQVRVINVGTLEGATQLRRETEQTKLSANEVATKYNWPMEVVTIPESAEGLVPAVKNVLFTSANPLKDFELSAGVPMDGGVRVFQIEKRIPRVKEVTDAMKTKFRAAVVENVEKQWAEQHLRSLVGNAQLNIIDPQLSVYYAEVIRRTQAAATQAATQAAATQATTKPKQP